MKKNLTKIISNCTIPFVVAGGLYFLTPKYGHAQDDEYLKKGGKVIEMLDKLSKTKPGQIIDKGRKDVENWAVKQGTGKTLDELQQEANQAIKNFGKDMNTSHKEGVNNYTPPKENSYKQEPKSTPKTEEELIKEQYTQKIKKIQDQAKRLSGDLDRNKIILLFKNKLNDNETPYDIDDIEWKLGSFTAKGEQEALVKFYDRRQCHANAASEIWLLKYRNWMWGVDRKLTENDSAEFETVDIQKDGKLEILIKDSGGNQGYFSTGTQLISIDEKTINVLHSNVGWDHTGAGKEGEALKKYEVKFSDINKDGILEVIETEKTETYAWKGKKQDFENYKKTSTKIIETIYKLQGDKYAKIKSSEKLSGIENIVSKLDLVYDRCKDYSTDALNSGKKVYGMIINFFKDTANTIAGFFTSKDYIEYSAKKGDTLSIIAKDKTGDWRNWKQILDYNKKYNYKNFDENINVGEKIYLPKHMLKK